MTAALPRVLVTRAAEDAPALSHALGEAGFQPVEVPALARLWDVDAVAALAREAGDADWLVVTSGTIADVLAVGAPGAWRRSRVAAVGPSTARRLEELGFRVDLTPETSTAEALVHALGDLRGLRVAWPKGDLAPDETAQALRDAGAEVIEAVAYANVEPPGFAARLADALPIDATTVLSGSAADRLAACVAPDQRWKLGRVVAIGPTTHRACEAAGLSVHAVARPHSVAGIVDALRTLFGRVR